MATTTRFWATPTSITASLSVASRTDYRKGFPCPKIRQSFFFGQALYSLIVFSHRLSMNVQKYGMV